MMPPPKVRVGERAYFHAMMSKDEKITKKYIGKMGIVTEVIENCYTSDAGKHNMVRIAYCRGSVMSILAVEGFVTCRRDVEFEEWAKHSREG